MMAADAVSAPGRQAAATEAGDSGPTHGLAEMLRTVTDSLEAELNARWPEEIRKRHPSEQRSYEREMEDVRRARVALAQHAPTPSEGVDLLAVVDQHGWSVMPARGGGFCVLGRYSPVDDPLGHGPTARSAVLAAIAQQSKDQGP